MLGETVRILTVDFTDLETVNQYADTIPTDSEVQTGACTARGAIFTAAIAAGMMVSQFVRWLRKEPTDVDLLYNIRVNALSVGRVLEGFVS
jgi:hypothetical protein